MKLPHDLYLIYREAVAKLNELTPSTSEVCYITMDQFGDIYEHDDEVFDEGPLWFSYGTSTFLCKFDTGGSDIPVEVWRLLKRRVDL